MIECFKAGDRAGGVGGGGVCSLANYSVAYEEFQSKRVSGFRDFVCSLFPKANIFYYFIYSAIIKTVPIHDDASAHSFTEQENSTVHASPDR